MIVTTFIRYILPWGQIGPPLINTSTFLKSSHLKNRETPHLNDEPLNGHCFDINKIIKLSMPMIFSRLCSYQPINRPNLEAYQVGLGLGYLPNKPRWPTLGYLPTRPRWFTLGYLPTRCRWLELGYLLSRYRWPKVNYIPSRPRWPNLFTQVVKQATYLLGLGGPCYLFSKFKLHTYNRPRLVGYLHS